MIQESAGSRFKMVAMQMFNCKPNKHHIKYPLFWKDNTSVSCHLMLAVLCCYAVTDCHELGGVGGLRQGMLGESKVETVPPRDAAPRSSHWKKEGATYQAVLRLTVMKYLAWTSLVTVGWAARGQGG